MATDVEPLRIADPSGRLAAEFIPGLGMVGVSLQHEGEELLAQLGGAEAYAERLKTFALPLLHPWANRLNAWEYTALGEHVVLHRDAPFIATENGLPIHGLLSACPDWQVVSHTGDVLVAEARLRAAGAVLRELSLPAPAELHGPRCGSRRRRPGARDLGDGHSDGREPLSRSRSASTRT